MLPGTFRKPPARFIGIFFCILVVIYNMFISHITRQRASSNVFKMYVQHQMIFTVRLCLTPLEEQCVYIMRQVKARRIVTNDTAENACICTQVVWNKSLRLGCIAFRLEKKGSKQTCNHSHSF